MADRSVQTRIRALQFHDETINLAEPSIGTYGQYLNSLQIVIENAESWHEAGIEVQLLRWNLWRV